METIKANIWGGQKEVFLCTWDEIERLGFVKRDRHFGCLNDKSNALFFYRYSHEEGYTWYVIKYDHYLKTQLERHVFSPMMQKQMEQGVQIPTVELLREIRNIDLMAVLSEEYHTREIIVRHFNKLFGTNIK